MKPLDYTLYNRVKEKFPPQHHAVIFVSLVPANLEKLEGIVFKVEEIHALFSVVGEHANAALPYAVIGGFMGESVSYHFASPEFVQEEDLTTGEIVTSSIGVYNNNSVDVADLRKEMQKFGNGTLLLGNA